jgi:peptidoglycan hydrolase-like protein with peptidoglycan-binding domain
LDLDDEQKGRISISDFNSNYSSFVLMPFITSSVINFQTYHFNWKASVVSSIENNQELIKQLLAQINFLKNEIAKLQAQLGLSQESKNFSCGEFENDLYFGMANSSEVECLQKFLTSQGENIYPEGWATGNFYTATQNAVIKYQALKGIMQTGYFGPLTRAAANFDMGF